MTTKTICFTNDPSASKAVPVYVTSNANERDVVLAREVKTADGADLFAFRVWSRQAAQMIVYLSVGASSTQ